MFRRTPVVEASDHAHVIRSRRPHRERDASLAFMSATMRAKLLIDSFVLAFAEEVEIDVTQSGRKTLCGTLRLCGSA